MGGLGHHEALLELAPRLLLVTLVLLGRGQYGAKHCPQAGNTTLMPGVLTEWLVPGQGCIEQPGAIPGPTPDMLLKHISH